MLLFLAASHPHQKAVKTRIVQKLNRKRVLAPNDTILCKRQTGTVQEHRVVSSLNEIKWGRLQSHLLFLSGFFPLTDLWVGESPFPSIHTVPSITSALWWQVWGGFQQVSKWKVCKWIRQTAWPYLCSLFLCWIHMNVGLCHVFPVSPRTWDSIRAGKIRWAEWGFQQQRVLQQILLASLPKLLGVFCAGKRRKAVLDKLKNSLVWRFGHKSERELVGWGLNRNLPDAVSVSSCCWYRLGIWEYTCTFPWCFALAGTSACHHTL